MEQEIKKLKEKRRKKRKRKKPTPAHVLPPKDKGDDSDENDPDAEMAYLPDTLINCPQHILLDTQHLLYENPQPTSLPQTIEVLHDTGASISMLPADFSSAWTNVRPSLHRLSGCFKGGEQQDNEIGEFHALITLDSGKTQRAIIPKAILVPSHKSNTYLLAHTPMLMVGHEYIILHPGETSPKI
jgi:hypothetical protein